MNKKFILPIIFCFCDIIQMMSQEKSIISSAEKYKQFGLDEIPISNKGVKYSSDLFAYFTGNELEKESIPFTAYQNSFCYVEFLNKTNDKLSAYLMVQFKDYDSEQ